MVSEPPRPRKVTSRSPDTPCAPPTTGVRPSSQRRHEPLGAELDDLGVGVGAVGDEPGLAAGEAVGRHAEVVQRHAEQGGGLALAGGDEHVHLPARPDLGHVAGQPDQLVGLLAHGARRRRRRRRRGASCARRGRRPRGCAPGRRRRSRRTSGRPATRRSTLPPRLRGRYELVGSCPSTSAPHPASCSRVVGLVGAQERADGPQVVAADRQDAAVVVPALEDDRPQVAQHGLRLRHGLQGDEVEHQATLGAAARRGPPHRAARPWARRRTSPGRAAAAGSGCGTPLVGAYGGGAPAAAGLPLDVVERQPADPPHGSQPLPTSIEKLRLGGSSSPPLAHLALRHCSLPSERVRPRRRHSGPPATTCPAREAVLDDMRPERWIVPYAPLPRLGAPRGPPLLFAAMPSEKRQRQDEGRLMRLEAQRTATQKVQRKRQARTIGLIVGAVIVVAGRHRHLQRRRRRRRPAPPTRAPRHHRHHEPGTETVVLPGAGASHHRGDAVPARRRLRRAHHELRAGPADVHRPGQDLHRHPRDHRGRHRHRARRRQRAGDREQLRGAVPLPLLRRRAVPSDRPGLREPGR